MVGRTLGHYRILDQIGAGGMGVVYRAHDLTLPRDVAIKILAPGTLTDDAARHRFRKEADSLACITHPNVATVHEFGTDNGVDYLVTEYIPGVTLDTRIAGRPLPIKDVLGLGAQFAHGLAAAHDHGLVHRDLKPGNLRVTPEGRLKILDFGLAHLAAGGPDALTVGTITDAGEVPGTLPYMSPEQLRGEPADVRSDIFAVGVVLYEMATGIRPFRGSTGPMTAHAILSAEPDPPHQHNHEVTPGLENVILKALEKDPAHRYQSVRELGIDLERLTSGASVPRPANRFGKIPLWGVVASVFVLILASVLFSPSLHSWIAHKFDASSPKHLAVLPFDSSGASPADQVLTAGFVESLTNRLSNIDPEQESLWIVPFSIVESRGVHDASAAWRQLSASLVINGRVRREGETIVLTATLINAQDLRQIGSVELEDRAGNVAVLQTEFVTQLARMMRIDARPEALRSGNLTVVPAAYEAYLEALGLMQRYDKPGNLDEAIAELKDATRRDPRFAVGYAALGEAYRLKYQVEHDPRWIEFATSESKQAIALSPHLPSAYVTLGRIHDDAGKYDLAVQEFSRAFDLHPRDADALTGMGHAYEHAGRLADAERAFSDAAAMRPEYWDGYNTLALFYDRHERYDEAITEIQKAIELSPDNAQVRSNLGAFYIDSGNPKYVPDAEKALRRSIELGPSYAAYSNLGFLYLQLKRCSEAVKITQQALDLNDLDYVEWENLAMAYQCLNMPKKAAEAREKELPRLEQDHKLKPEDDHLRSALGVLYARKQQRRAALPLLEAAVAHAPDDPVVLRNAGITYELLNERQRSIEYISKGLQKGITMSELQEDPDLRLLFSDPRISALSKK
jgi:serine/threonine-protein kinase